MFELAMRMWAYMHSGRAPLGCSAPLMNEALSSLTAEDGAALTTEAC